MTSKATNDQSMVCRTGISRDIRGSGGRMALGRLEWKAATLCEVDGTNLAPGDRSALLRLMTIRDDTIDDCIPRFRLRASRRDAMIK